VVDNNLGDVISQSFGISETCVPAYVKAIHKVFLEAEAKHITVLASAGDNGAAALLCDSAGNVIGVGRGVQTPESDPLVTSIGGTTLFVDRKGRYDSETSWDESSSTLPFGTNDATGGGFSAVYGKPSYQNDVPGIKTHRGVPDVAYDAALASATIIICSSCDPGHPGTQVLDAGGTSAGCPQWAAIVVLADELAGKDLGFLNPTLYEIGSDRSWAFHDVRVGVNTYAFKDQKGNPAQVVGYATRKGWDPVTGFGSPDVAQLLPLLAQN
jgi:subtilase family serine protease